MFRVSSKRARAASLVIAAAVAGGCGDKTSEQKKTPPTAGSAMTKKQRPSAKAAAMETVLLWDASVQKMQEEVAKAEAEGDAARAEDFRKKLKVSQDGLEQAKRKLRILENVQDQEP